MPMFPEIFILSMACIVLIVDLSFSQAQRYLSFGLTLLTLVGAATITLFDYGEPARRVFHGMFIDDDLSDLLKLGIYTLTFFVFVYSRGYLAERAMYRGEYFVLGLFGVIGMMIMASAGHLLVLYLGLELLSLSLYAMVAFQRDSYPATEAAMKYFVLGALASGMLLYGMSMLYGVTGSLDIVALRQGIAGVPEANKVVLIFGLVFVVVGLAFKLGVVPFHMWVPDVYHGAPTAVTLYLATAPKLAGFALVMRLLVGGLQDLSIAWQDMLIVMAVLSMAVGNVIAIAQTNIKRMLAYSSISHMGFFLLGILSAGANGYGSALFYVMVYTVMSLGTFGMVVLLSRDGFEADRLDDFRGLNRRDPWHAFLMLLLMFSMAGVPPTAGFYAKLAVIQVVVQVNLVWLAAVAVLFSVIGAYYYLRVVKLMYFDAPVDTAALRSSADMRALIAVNALSLIAITPWLGALLRLCGEAIQSLV
jgi:NADH-quinone oxidoreductase subunit N